MILYLDASALVKRYVTEPGSGEVGQAITKADLVGTVLVSRAEVAAALAKAVRVGVLRRKEALTGLQLFRRDWPNLVRVQITENTVSRADSLAWEHDLRGYDAIHLAAASVWQEAMDEMVTLATFDHSLWTVAEKAGLIPFPENLPALLKQWKASKSGKW